MTHQFLASLLSGLLQLVGTLVLAVVGSLIAKYVRNKTAADTLSHLTSLAATIVAATEQTVVAKLKSSGSWNASTMKTTAEDAAFTLVRQAKIELPQALQLIEAAVLNLPSNAGAAK